jgi:general secretion pathway protein A
VLVIDESQNLQPDVLEQIRLLSNLETENDKLIQIILAGQPELGTLLERPELRQLNQRIAVRYRLNAMSLYETRAYIRHRMEVAGESGGVAFTLFATRCIYMFTRGVPRMINILCDRCLLIAYGDERRRITAGVVARGIRELLNAPRSNRLSQAFAGVIGIAVVCIILSLVLPGWMPGKRDAGVHRTTSSPVAAEYSPATAAAPDRDSDPGTAAAAPRMIDHPFAQIQQEIVSYNLNDSHLLAFNTIADRWGAAPIRVFNGQFTIPDTFKRFAARRELQITEFKGTLEDVIRFDVPFLAVTKVSGRLGRYCIAVTSTGVNFATVSPLLFGSSTLSKNDLKTVAGDTFYLVWLNSGHVPTRLQPGDRRNEIRALQMQLQKAGFYNDAIDGYYGSATAKAVGDFQRNAGITRNETVGELTLAALAKYSPDRKNKPVILTPGSQK